MCSRWVDLLDDNAVLDTGVLVVEADAPADACFADATTADRPPLPVCFNAGLLLDGFVPVADPACLGVAGNSKGRHATQ